jgi:serine-type D-Ala-D-Ala carboxypeptidase (penicillin-binding protein 5/6)
MRVTVRDLAELARHIIQTYPDFYKLYAEHEFTWNNIRQQNRNPLLNLEIGADGLKASYSDENGYGLVGSDVQDGRRLILVMDGMMSEKQRIEEVKKLFEWGFHNFESRLLFAEDQTVGEARVYGGQVSHVPLASAHDVKLMVVRGVNKPITAWIIVYTGPVVAPVHQGQAIGVLRVWRGDTLAVEVPPRATGDVGVGNLVQRAFDAIEELIIDLFIVMVQHL